MKRTIGIIVFCVLFSVIGFKAYSQMSVSYYSSSFSKIGLGYNFNDRLWSELRLYSYTSLLDITPEIVVCYNIVKKEKPQCLSRIWSKYKLLHWVCFACWSSIYTD